MIVDTNVIISILIDPKPQKVDFVKINSFQAPNLLKIELINVLRKYHFLNNLSKESAFSYYKNGTELIDSFFDENEILPKAIDISFAVNHPIYDCIYLSLAIHLNMPFVSIDKKLLTKAKTLGIEVIDFESI
jgi:predicted nucleic acid-binding protein